MLPGCSMPKEYWNCGEDERKFYDGMVESVLSV